MKVDLTQAYRLRSRKKNMTNAIRMRKMRAPTAIPAIPPPLTDSETDHLLQLKLTCTGELSKFHLTFEFKIRF